MSEMIVAAAAVVGLVVVSVAHLVAARSRAASWLDDAVRRRVLVHTRDGQTLDGQLARVDCEGLVLSPASLEGQYQLGGEVWVSRERIAWLQHPPETGDE